MTPHLRNLDRVPAVVAAAYLAHSVGVLADSARVLGREADADRYARLAEQVQSAWHATFVSAGGGQIGDDRQDDYVRALALELLPAPEECTRALGRLVELIERNGGHLDTGFLSTPMLLPTLRPHGRPDLAHRLQCRTRHRSGCTP